MPGENAGCEFVVGFIGHGQHFVFCVKVVYVVESEGLRCGGQGRGPELPGAVVARDEVQQVGANQVAGWG